MFHRINMFQLLIFLDILNIFVHSRSVGSSNTERNHNVTTTTELWLEARRQTSQGDYDILDCPPLPKDSPLTICDAEACNSDEDCPFTEGKKCCHNGCVNTCMDALQPPPVFDWLKEPPRIVEESNIEEVKAEPCSISLQHDATNSEDTVEYFEDGEDIGNRGNGFADSGEELLCPSGYRCNIEHNGDDQREIPQTGHCIPDHAQDVNKERHPPHESTIEQKDGDETMDPSSPSCVFHDKLYKDGQNFVYHRHRCFCTHGEIDCIIR